LKDWFIAQSTPDMYRGGRRRDAAQGNTAEEDSARFDREFGVEAENSSSSREGSVSGAEGLAPSASQTQKRHSNFASAGNDRASLDRAHNQVSGVDFQSGSALVPSSDITGPPGPPQPSTDEQTALKRKGSPAKDFDTATQSRDAYGRASGLLREATGAFGVVFLDASAASAVRPLNTPDLRDRSNSPGNTTGTPSASSNESRAQTNSDTDTSDNGETGRKPCKIIGRSIQFQSGKTGVTLPLNLNERDMAKLIKSYPSGKIFNFEVSGTPYSGSDESAGSEVGSSGSALETETKLPRGNSRHNRHARLLGKAVGNARSIAFFPIFDATNNRYRSCLFTWTIHPNRFFDTQEDITYLSAFGHSLRAEFSRIETTASDVAKGKFISSVSHELRSVF
jgi:hypothetical protein